MTRRRFEGPLETSRALRARTGRRRLRLPRSTSRRRVAGLLVVYLLGLGLLAGRLVQVQVVDAAAYQERGEAQSRRVIDLPAQRGRIYDRAGAVLASTVDAAAIYVDPSVFRRRDDAADDADDATDGVSRRAVAEQLAAHLDVTVEEAMAALGSQGQFAYVARQVDWKVGEQVMALELPGVHRLTEPARRYPVGPIAAPLLGFTDIDGHGLEGIEARYDDVLTGEPGQVMLERAGVGSLDIASAERNVTPSVPGTDLVLTLHRDIQAEAQRVAAEAVEANDAAGASVVVLSVRTGEVLAAASAPSFDPLARDGTTHDDRRARPFTDAVEPGSVQKAITMAAAWEEGLVDEDTVLDVPETLTIGGKTWDSPHGTGGKPMDVGEILERSSNVGTMQVAEMLGAQRLDDWLRRFGYAQPTGLGFPGETPGILIPAETWSATSLPTIAIGHGVAVSTLQLASFYQVLANDGVRVTPSMLRGTVGADGELRPADQPDAVRILSEETARAIRTRLQAVVDGEFGTGKSAAVNGYDVAGKTGTAAKPRPDGRGYSNKYTAVFAGLAPVDDPELVVAVMVDEPVTVYGGAAAAPAFSEIMGYALGVLDVPPTSGQASLDEALDSARQAGAEAAALAEARRLAAQEELGADADAPGSPPVGIPAGGGPPVGQVTPPTATTAPSPGP